MRDGNRRSLPGAVLISGLLIVLLVVLLNRGRWSARDREERAAVPAAQRFEQAPSSATPREIAEWGTPNGAEGSPPEDPAGGPPAEASGEALTPEEELAQFYKEHGIRPGDHRDHVMALFDVNEDGRPDLLVFEKKSLVVSQILVAGEAGGLGEPAKKVTVPDYVQRFLAVAAKERPKEGVVVLQDEDGQPREIVLLNDED
jgi:hypothetical protein